MQKEHGYIPSELRRTYKIVLSILYLYLLFLEEKLIGESFNLKATYNYYKRLLFNLQYLMSYIAKAMIFVALNIFAHEGGEQIYKSNKRLE